MSHSLAELALLAQRTVKERLQQNEAGEWRFRHVHSGALPSRIASLRKTGLSTNEIIAEFTELTAVDVKAARISSYLQPVDLLERLDLLALPEHAELVTRLHELASILHDGRGCCR